MAFRKNCLILNYLSKNLKLLYKRIYGQPHQYIYLCTIYMLLLLLLLLLLLYYYLGMCVGCMYIFLNNIERFWRNWERTHIGSPSVILKQAIACTAACTGIWRLLSSGMCHPIVRQKFTDVLKKRAVSFHVLPGGQRQHVPPKYR
jgi:hypothetical protein